MSFSENVRAELLGQPRKLTCCKKAFVYGLLINSFPTPEGVISLETESEILANEVSGIIKEQFGKSPQKSVRNRMGHERSIFAFSSRSGVDTLKSFDENSESSYSSLVGFRCDGCRMNFLRGAFLSSASVSDPMKSYHLEFILKSAQRAKLLFSELRDMGFSPKIANRRGGVGLYFKESEAIEDILTHLGASRMLFECMNDKIFREIRNDTNRRANCETGNIAKSINASQELIASIKRIEEAGLLAALPDELCETARIRLEHPEASMSEICAMFSPPLSKSGLSHRFSKIKRFAEDIGKK